MRAQGEFALVSEQMQLALDKPGQPVKRGTMAHEHEVYMILVETAVQRQDTPSLRQFIPRLEELAERDDHILYRAIAQRAWGALRLLEGEFTEADSQLNCALSSFVELGARWQSGLTLVKLAELEVERHNQDGARQFYSKALAEFQALKASLDVARVQAALTGLV